MSLQDTYQDIFNWLETNNHLKEVDSAFTQEELLQLSTYKEFKHRLISTYEVGEAIIVEATSEILGLPFLTMDLIEIDNDSFSEIRREDCVTHECLPFKARESEAIYSVGIVDPFNYRIESLIRSWSGGKGVELCLITEDVLNTFLRRYADLGKVDYEVTLDRLKRLRTSGATASDLDEESTPIVDLVGKMIQSANYQGASDIHIDPLEEGANIRFRVDGVLKNEFVLPKIFLSALVSRLKIMANLDISNNRNPQDGRIIYADFNTEGLDLDLRVSTAPFTHGEGVVMRLLDKSKSTLPLTALGFSDDNLTRYRAAIKRPYGMVLHCGPTGSGKSMSLYAALGEIYNPGISIKTAEDPVEYTINGITQMQVRPKQGLTFGDALRCFLRQDPDIILVGEMRDTETAEIAVEAALTGHLLFSTLHTQNAAATVTRLVEMGVEPYLVGSTMNCICSQRLMRRVCKYCAEKHPLEGEDLKVMNEGLHKDFTGVPLTTKAPDGCSVCNYTGYKGRVGIHELMIASETLQNAISSQASEEALQAIAENDGMKTLHQDALLKITLGFTDMTEMFRIAPPAVKSKKVEEIKATDEVLIDKVEDKAEQEESIEATDRAVIEEAEVEAETEAVNPIAERIARRAAEKAAKKAAKKEHRKITAIENSISQTSETSQISEESDLDEEDNSLQTAENQSPFDLLASLGNDDVRPEEKEVVSPVVSHDEYEEEVKEESIEANREILPSAIPFQPSVQKEESLERSIPKPEERGLPDPVAVINDQEIEEVEVEGDDLPKDEGGFKPTPLDDLPKPRAEDTDWKLPQL